MGACVSAEKSIQFLKEWHNVFRYVLKLALRRTLLIMKLSVEGFSL